MPPSEIRMRDVAPGPVAGRPPDHRIRLDELSCLEQRRLRDTFRTITETQRPTGARFHQD